jgi:Cyclin M transmembrane N-terminal domain
MLGQAIEQPREETMPTGDGSLANIFGILAIFVLVAANGFFVAAEFALVAVRRSRVAQLVARERGRWSAPPTISMPISRRPSSASPFRRWRLAGSASLRSPA